MEAVILDLDGVITQTARVHKEAWKKMFDEYLQRIQGNDSYEALTDNDYLEYIDGKPRYEGVKSFLASRDISLPFGDPEDPPDKESICGLGNRKNEYFRQIIKKDGVAVYEDAVSRIRLWREHGLKTAVVSSSKNCKHIIESAGISDLFDIRVDGIVREEKNLKGKPSPDIFVEAAKGLDIYPGQAVVFEDAIAGVQAADKGGFAFVVGVGRTGKKTDLLHNGADIVVRDLEEIDLFDHSLKPYFTQNVPSVFSEQSKFHNILNNNTPVVFLDYDGTLTPIVSQPEDAVLSDEMSETLDELADLCTVAIITGRDMDNVKELVKLDNLIYAGSHGFRISGPDGLYQENQQAMKLLAKLDSIEKVLQERIGKKISGARIERKRYAIAVHYRNTDEKDIPAIRDHIDEVLKKHTDFKTGGGKKIIEVKPGIDWHKGRAVEWILDTLGYAGKENIIPIYIGDDLTDEDAFDTLADKGIGILVGFHEETTSARYSLKNVLQVKNFLRMIISHCQTL